MMGAICVLCGKVIANNASMHDCLRAADSRCKVDPNATHEWVSHDDRNPRPQTGERAHDH
jgi:hypothetical protein